MEKEDKYSKEIHDYMLKQIEQFIRGGGVKRFGKSRVGPNKFVQGKKGKKGKWVPRGR